MADALNLFPARVQFVDPATGMLTVPAQKAMQLLLVRVGGVTAPTINELTVSDDEDSGLEELRHEFSKTFQGLQSAPVMQESQAVEFLLTQVAEAQALITELRRELEDLKQGQMI